MTSNYNTLNSNISSRYGNLSITTIPATVKYSSSGWVNVDFQAGADDLPIGFFAYASYKPSDNEWLVMNVGGIIPLPGESYRGVTFIGGYGYLLEYSVSTSTVNRISISASERVLSFRSSQWSYVNGGFVQSSSYGGKILIGRFS